MVSGTGPPIDCPSGDQLFDAGPPPLTPDVPANVAELAARFTDRVDISARSLLVTVFGDSILPAGGEIWLSDLIRLCQPFGFSDRLIRTSMYRLNVEGWFVIERVGRQSLYRLSPTAYDEFARAEHAIYQPPTFDWDGQWTLIIFPPDEEQAEPISLLVSQLIESGYRALTPRLYGVPRDEHDHAQAMINRFGLSGCLAVGQASFGPLGPLVGNASHDPLDLNPVADRYRRFVEQHGPSLLAAATSIASNGDQSYLDFTDQWAFALRIMAIHDYRRARLADPQFPGELLPTDWPQPGAYRLAASIYNSTSSGSRSWIDRVMSNKQPDSPPSSAPTAYPNSDYLAARFPPL